MLPVTTHSAPCDTVLYAIDVQTNATRCALIRILMVFFVLRADAHIGAAYKTTNSQTP
jgi:hypothetical protein